MSVVKSYGYSPSGGTSRNCQPIRTQAELDGLLAELVALIAEATARPYGRQDGKRRSSRYRNQYANPARRRDAYLRLRYGKGLTLAEAAARAGISERTAQRYEPPGRIG